MTPTLQNQFPNSPELFPHMWDVPSDQILISKLSEAEYKAASFLDQRLLTPQLPRQTATWEQMKAIPLPETRPAYYIFHIGHVGSTLISRLLGESPNALALREPYILRAFADMSPALGQAHTPWSQKMYQERLTWTQKALARTFLPQQRALIKASSFVSEISERLITSKTKALFLYASFERYLETILAGDGSQKEALQLAGPRLARLNARLDAPLANLWELSFVQKIALGWLCEMAALYQTSKNKQHAQILWLDFDQFLQRPAAELLRISDHLETGLDEPAADALTRGPIMSTYSKAPEHAYSADLRQDLMRQARHTYGADINAVKKWTEELTARHDLIDKVFNAASRTDYV